MTDDDKAQNWCSEKLPCARYEALSAENERLRDQLEYAVGELSKYRAKYMVGTSPVLEEKSE